jgi:hypothetical protein
VRGKIQKVLIPESVHEKECVLSDLSKTAQNYAQGETMEKPGHLTGDAFDSV